MIRAITRVVVAITFGSAALTGTAEAVTVLFNDFSNTSSLDLNGSATTTTTGDGQILRLTPAQMSQSGSAFSLTQINAATFSTYFKFRITNPGGGVFDCNTQSGADGLVFAVQNVSSSVGGAGQGIGYAGISPSVGVEFDTWCNAANNDPSSNHIGIDLNGNVNHGAGAPHTLNVATPFDDGNVWHVWIDYNGVAMEVRANQTGLRPVASMLTREFSGLNGTQTLSQVLGQNNAYIGFTSGTGADYGNHDILAWEYRDSFDPIATPAPLGAAMMGLGVMALAVLRRRARSAARL